MAVLTAAACLVSVSRLTVDYLPSPASASLPRVTDRARPLLGWQLASLAAPGTLLPAAQAAQSAYRIVVASSPALLPGAPDIYDSGRVASADSVAVPYGGPALASRARAFFAVETWDGTGASCGFGAEGPGAWEVPLLDEAAWAGAQWLTRDAQPHAPPAVCDLYADDPSPLLRADFALAQPAANVARARVYAAGLGYFLPFLDGAQLGDEVLAPAWTAFNSTILYSTLDATAALRTAPPPDPSRPLQHTLGFALGNGFFNLTPLLFWGHKSFRDALPTGDPMVRALLAVDFADGSSQTLTTSAAPGTPWTVGASEVRYNSVYLGTRIDRRLEPLGWSTPGFAANASAAWAAPHVADAAGAAMGAALRSQSAPPVRRQAPLALVAVTAPQATELVLDWGRQTSGVCRLCFAPVPAGTRLNVRYGELLYHNGSVNGLTSVAGQVKNGNGGSPCAPTIAFAEDHYVFRGDGYGSSSRSSSSGGSGGSVSDAGGGRLGGAAAAATAGECFEPPFTWHGARYASLTGDAAALAALDAAATTCSPLRSDVAVTGSFASSSALLDAATQLGVTAFENNLISVQSDCPARERLGYSGDALMSGESLIMTFDMSLFYEKRLQDMVEAQRPNGGFTETAPFVGISDAGLGGGSGPVGWQTFGPSVASWLLKYYANDGAVAAAFPASVRYVELLAAVGGNGSVAGSAVEAGLGDWMTLEPSALPLTGRGFQLVSYREHANLSLAVGNLSQAAAWSAAADVLEASINARFLDAATGAYGAAGVFNATQCGQAMPLFLRIVPDAARAAALRVLAANLAKSGGHLSVGSFGVKYLLMALSDNGMADAAWRVMNTTDYPGYGYMLNGTKNGLTDATTLWESWATSDNTYSNDHGMFGGNVVYAYQALAGLQPHPAARGGDRFLVKPVPPSFGAGLDWVNASLALPRGTLASAWRYLANGSLALTLTVPPGVEAEVWLPLSGRRFALGGACAACTWVDDPAL